MPCSWRDLHLSPRDVLLFHLSHIVSPDHLPKPGPLYRSKQSLHTPFDARNFRNGNLGDEVSRRDFVPTKRDPSIEAGFSEVWWNWNWSWHWHWQCDSRSDGLTCLNVTTCNQHRQHCTARSSIGKIECLRQAQGRINYVSPVLQQVVVGVNFQSQERRNAIT